MTLDYGTQLTPSPIALSIGTIRKPTLQDISDLSFEMFSYYEFLLKLTPDVFIDKFNINKDEIDTNNFSTWNIIFFDNDIQQSYLDMLNFFFVENIVLFENYFVILKSEEKDIELITPEDIKGAISEKNFKEIFNIIQQLCCIKTTENDEEENPNFKNSLAEKIYNKLKHAKKKNQETEDSNFSIPNIISAVANFHPSLNYCNIWNLTMFQLLDAFNRLQTNAIYDIDSRRVSVWGDEKKTFDSSLWYKRYHK